MKRNIVVLAVAFLLGFAVEPVGAQTLKAVKDRGALLCGVTQGIAASGIPAFERPRRCVTPTSQQFEPGS